MRPRLLAVRCSSYKKIYQVQGSFPLSRQFLRHTGRETGELQTRFNTSIRLLLQWILHHRLKKSRVRVVAHVHGLSSDLFPANVLPPVFQTVAHPNVWFVGRSKTEQAQRSHSTPVIGR